MGPFSTREINGSVSFCKAIPRITMNSPANGRFEKIQSLESTRGSFCVDYRPMNTGMPVGIIKLGTGFAARIKIYCVHDLMSLYCQCDAIIKEKRVERKNLIINGV